MKWFSWPRLNIRRDYERVRRWQRALGRRPVLRYRTFDLTIGPDDGRHEVHVRYFKPLQQRRDDVLLFFHGGGWVTGDIESYTPACATMADLTGCRVASVDYRLAPEFPFPAGLEDCWRVTRTLLEHPGKAGADGPGRLVLVGDSAGGNLVAALSLLLHERGLPGAARQILLYPVTHWDHDPRTSPFESVRRHGEDYRLTNTEVQDYLELYVPDPERRKDPLVSPLMAEDLSGQPRTLLITAELDLLCDEGEAYGEALRAAGTEVTMHRLPGALHGVITLPRFARPLREAYEVINAFLDETDDTDDTGGGRDTAATR